MAIADTACPKCEGAGCNSCQWTGFAAGVVPEWARRSLAKAGLDPAELAADVARHPANRPGADL